MLKIATSGLIALIIVASVVGIGIYHADMAWVRADFMYSAQNVWSMIVGSLVVVWAIVYMTRVFLFPGR